MSSVKHSGRGGNLALLSTTYTNTYTFFKFVFLLTFSTPLINFHGLSLQFHLASPNSKPFHLDLNWVMDMASSPRTVEEIFKDYSARRTGVIRALTHGTTLLSPMSLSFSSIFLSHLLMTFLPFSSFRR